MSDSADIYIHCQGIPRPSIVHQLVSVNQNVFVDMYNNTLNHKAIR